MDAASGGMSRSSSATVLLGLLALCFAVAVVGGVSTTEAIRVWYPTLDKPPWTPPNWAFGPVWTFLYTAMAVAAWDLVRREGTQARAALALFGAQLVLNALWSPVFFAARQLLLGLVIISGMWVLILACIVVFWRHSRLSSALMVPYLAWVSVAWSLNAWIFWFN